MRGKIHHLPGQIIHELVAHHGGVGIVGNEKPFLCRGHAKHRVAFVKFDLITSPGHFPGRISSAFDPDVGIFFSVQIKGISLIRNAGSTIMDFFQGTVIEGNMDSRKIHFRIFAAVPGNKTCADENKNGIYQKKSSYVFFQFHCLYSLHEVRITAGRQNAMEYA